MATFPSYYSSTYRRDAPPNPPVSELNRDFIALARERFRLAEEGEAKVREKSLEDFRFKIGEQWEPTVFQARDRDARPCLTMNRMRQFCRMVTNEQRQQRPSIQINPVGSQADVATAEVLQGIIRHIEMNSQADIAYDHGFESMVTGGFGYWMVKTKYVEDDTDEQEIFICRILNPFTVFFDPRAVEPDYSDAIYAFIIEDMPLETYRANYPNSSLAAITMMATPGNIPYGWLSASTVRVAEYFYVEEEERPRGRPKRTVRWAKINAIEPLDEDVVPCRYIPIVPVLGDETIVDGRKDLVGLIRDARDPQRMYNFQISAAAEMIALAPKAPHIAAEGQIEGHEVEWAESNRRNFSVLTYKPVSSANGAPMPPPQRNAAEPPIQAMALMIRQADNDLKAVTGIYDASLGQQGPEQSGKAVLLRQQQSSIANLNYTDNMARAIRCTGNILLDMIPRIYTDAQIKRIILPDGEVKHVGIMNSQTSDDTPEEVAEQLAVTKVHDIGIGRYDVNVSTGPNYETKRKENIASEVALISAYPAIMPIAGDLLVRNFDWPQASEIADRLKAMLPPQVQQAQGGDPTMTIAQLQAQLAQAQQQMQQMGMLVQKAQSVIGNKLVEGQTKENLALIDAWTKLNVARLNASKDADTAQADRETQMLTTMMGQAHEAGSQAMEHQHDMNLQQMGAAQQQQPQVGAPPPGANPQAPPPQEGPVQPGGSAGLTGA